MKRFLCFLLAVSLTLSGCAHVSQYQSNRTRLHSAAETELKSISANCQKKNNLTDKAVSDIDTSSKPITKAQYMYSICYAGAKYIAFNDYFEDKVAWKQNLKSNTRVIRDLYQRRISRKVAEKKIALNNATFQNKETIAVNKIITELEGKDKDGENAALAGLLLAVIVVAAVAASNSGGSGNSYSGGSYSSSYSGNCPCPYSRDAAGNVCGNRSAWSRNGGASPQCY